jgi:HEAT repeat protein
MTRLQAVGLASALLACAIPARAEEPRAVVTRAIKAMGGDVDAAQNPAASAKIRVKGLDFPINATGEVHFQPATAFRFDVTLDIGNQNQKEQGTVVFDGTKGWAKMNGMLQEMPESELAMTRAVIRLFSPSLLPSLLADKAVTLTALPAGVVDGRPTHVVKADFADKTAFQLQFDQVSGLLVSKSVKLPSGPGEEFVVVLSRYEESGMADDARVLREAGIDTNGPALVAFLRKQAPDPKQVAQAAVLIKALGDDSFDVREKAGEDLIALGAIAVPHLERAQKNPDAEVARRAKQCLDVIAKRNDGRVLSAAIRQVVWGKVEGGTEALLKLLPGADGATAREAKAALVALAERNGQVLTAALQDPDPVIREAAAAVLGKDGGTYLKQPSRRLFLRGLKQPATLKLLVAGRAVADMEITEIAYFNQIDPKLFAKP